MEAGAIGKVMRGSCCRDEVLGEPECLVSRWCINFMVVRVASFRLIIFDENILI